MAWLPVGFVHPLRVDLSTDHHLRPIRESDVALDYPAVMGSRERLWSQFGEAWGWPQASMTFEEDRDDLARHEREIEAHESFNYAIFDEAETALLGCVYIDPPEDGDPPGTEANVAWWVVDGAVGTPLEVALEDGVRRWLTEEWPFAAIRRYP